MKKQLSVSFSIAIISLLPVLASAQFEKESKAIAILPHSLESHDQAAIL